MHTHTLYHVHPNLVILSKSLYADTDVWWGGQRQPLCIAACGVILSCRLWVWWELQPFQPVHTCRRRHSSAYNFQWQTQGLPTQGHELAGQPLWTGKHIQLGLIWVGKQDHTLCQFIGLPYCHVLFFFYTLTVLLSTLFFFSLQGINGILADEMGLGKTVQSIALLAHLAEVREQQVKGFCSVYIPKKLYVIFNWFSCFYWLMKTYNIQHLHPFLFLTFSLCIQSDD